MSETEFGSGYPNDGDGLRHQEAVDQVIKGDNAWTINLAVFLKEAAGAKKINIVYYDLSAKHMSR